MGQWYGERAEVYDQTYVATTLSVGSTQIEAKVGGSRDEKRQLVILYNDSNNTVYYGPTGVATSGANKGIPIEKRQEVAVPVGDVGLYLIAGSSGNNVICQELG